MEIVSICNVKQGYDSYEYMWEGFQLFNDFELVVHYQLSNFQCPIQFKKMLYYQNPKWDSENLSYWHQFCTIYWYEDGFGVLFTMLDKPI